MAQPNRERSKGTPQNPPILAPNWFIGLVPREYWNVKKSFFIYEQDFAVPQAGSARPSLGANATDTGNIQIQADSHFLAVCGVVLITSIDNITVLNSPSNANASGILALITDVGSGAPLSQVPVPLESMFGTGILPAVWPLPKLFYASGTIAVQLTNLLGTARNVRLSFWGIRIYEGVAA
jgi:hypothetical protein